MASSDKTAMYYWKRVVVGQKVGRKKEKEDRKGEVEVPADPMGLVGEAVVGELRHVKLLKDPENGIPDHPFLVEFAWKKAAPSAAELLKAFGMKDMF